MRFNPFRFLTVRIDSRLDVCAYFRMIDVREREREGETEEIDKRDRQTIY